MTELERANSNLTNRPIDQPILQLGAHLTKNSKEEEWKKFSLCLTNEAQRHVEDWVEV
jgi:hypothetical protein